MVNNHTGLAGVEAVASPPPLQVDVVKVGAHVED